MTTLLTLCAIVIVIALLWIRYAPINSDDWHVDPAEVEFSGNHGLKMIGREAPRFVGDAEAVLETFTEIARGEPNTRILEGDADEGMMTFVSRSKILGLAEVITVKAVAEGARTKLSIASRPRFTFSGRGTTEERMDRWLQDMRLRLGEG